MEKIESFVRLSKQTDQICNVHIVAFIFHLSAEGHIHIHLANTEIGLSKLGISENIDITSKSLQQLFCSLQSMKLCSGLKNQPNLTNFLQSVMKKSMRIIKRYCI